MSNVSRSIFSLNELCTANEAQKARSRANIQIDFQSQCVSLFNMAEDISW